LCNRLADETKYKEADEDERQYREQVESEKDRNVFELNEEQKVELKMKFRKATVLCNPDKVSEEYKIAAQNVFIELKKAHDTNNLKKVNEILDDLLKGNFFKSRSETVTEKDLLKIAIADLSMKIKTLEIEIVTIKRNETFTTINNIIDWDEYFNQTKEKLQRELKNLQLEVDVLPKQI